MLSRLAPFIGLVAVLVAIPGPAVVLIMKTSVLRGRRSAATTAIGVFVGDLVWVTASVAGLTAVLMASRPAFEVLRFAGAAYLIYLGVRLMLSRRHGDADVQTTVPTPRRSGQRAFVEGLLCELSNPKALLVFTSVIPPFLPSSSSSFELAVFGLVFATVGLGSLLVYVLVFGASRRLVRRPRFADRLMRGSGGILTAFGLWLSGVPRPVLTVANLVVTVMRFGAMRTWMFVHRRR